MKRSQASCVLLGFCLLVAVPAITRAQSTDPVKSLRLGTGYVHLRMLDRLVSPLPYQSNMVPISLAYQSRTENGLFEVSLDLLPGMADNTGEFKDRAVVLSGYNGDGNITSSELALAPSFFGGDELTVKYLRRLNRPASSGVQLYAGAECKQFFYLSFPMVPILFHSELSLGPSLAADWQAVEGTTLRASASLPLLSLITRLPYSTDPVDGEHGYLYVTYRTGSRLTSVHQYQRVNLGLEFQKQMGDGWSLGAAYRFCWLGDSARPELHAYANSILLHATIHLNPSR
ncbi:MAG: hypothetical protein R2751_07035 [Bacteroidales bacterium]